MRASPRTDPPTRPHRCPDPTQQLPPYSPYGYDPYATGQYGRQYPPGATAARSALAQVATLAVGGGRGGGASRCRPGDRVGGRQQLETGDGRRAAADAGTNHDDHQDADDDAVAAAAAADRPGADHHTAQRVRYARRNRDGGLRGQRQRQGDQHHLRRHRQRAADRVQRRPAVAQGSGVAQPGRGIQRA